RWTSLYNLVRMKRDQGILLSVEEVLALQLAVLHSASGTHAFCLDFDVQGTGCYVGRCKGEGGIPLVESAGNCHRGLYIELDRTVFRRDCENWSLLLAQRWDNRKTDDYQSHRAESEPLHHKFSLPIALLQPNKAPNTN